MSHGITEALHSHVSLSVRWCVWTSGRAASPVTCLSVRVCLCHLNFLLLPVDQLAVASSFVGTVARSSIAACYRLESQLFNMERVSFSHWKEKKGKKEKPSGPVFVFPLFLSWTPLLVQILIDYPVSSPAAIFLIDVLLFPFNTAFLFCQIILCARFALQQFCILPSWLHIWT